MKKISFITAVYNHLDDLTKPFYKHLRENFPYDEIVITDGSENNDTKEFFESIEDDYNLIYKKINNLAGIDKAIKLATNEIIVIVHNDMYISKNFKEKILEDIKENNIVMYSRVEPPVFPTPGIGKILLDLGYSFDDFKKDDFENFSKIYNTKHQGYNELLFMALYKKNWIGFDNETFPQTMSFCSDNDIHIRYRLSGISSILSDALVYHFVSKTSQVKREDGTEQKHYEQFQNKWNKIINLNQ